jgi:hypothetical protein
VLALSSDFPFLCVLHGVLVLTRKGIDDVNNKGKTPLHEATSKGCIEVMVRSHSLRAVPRPSLHLFRVLHWHASSRVSSKAILLQFNANPNLHTLKRQTPLHMAVLQRYPGQMP